MEVLFLIVVLALITIIICVTAGVISNRKKGGSEEMGGEPAGEKAEKKPEKTGEKRRRAPEAPDPRLHVIYMEEESFTKKTGRTKQVFTSREIWRRNFPARRGSRNGSVRSAKRKIL